MYRIASATVLEVVECFGLTPFSFLSSFGCLVTSNSLGRYLVILVTAPFHHVDFSGLRSQLQFLDTSRVFMCMTVCGEEFTTSQLNLCALILFQSLVSHSFRCLGQGYSCQSSYPSSSCIKTSQCVGDGTCKHIMRSSGTICRPAVDICDQPER